MQVAASSPCRHLKNDSSPEQSAPLRRRSKGASGDTGADVKRPSPLESRLPMTSKLDEAAYSSKGNNKNENENRADDKSAELAPGE